MKRSFDPHEPELMDVPQPVTPEFEQDLKNLTQLNRYFGGHRLVRRFLKCWIQPGRSYRLLDLATGPGDVPRMIVRWARTRGVSVKIDAIDLHPATLEIARKRSADFPEITFIRADARTFSEVTTYDLVCCSLALHHFSEPDAAKILRRACELSHDKVLISDLERSWLTSLCVHVVTAALFRDRMTRYDGRLSARRAFSFREFDALAQQAGWRGYGHCRFLPARQALWMSAKDEAPAVDMGNPALDFAT